MNNQTSTQLQASGFAQAGPITPSTPTVLAYATEVLNHIFALEDHIADMRIMLLADDSRNPPLQNQPTSLITLLADASARAAMLCGELATLKSRLGCNQSG